MAPTTHIRTHHRWLLDVATRLMVDVFIICIDSLWVFISESLIHVKLLGIHALYGKRETTIDSQVIVIGRYEHT